MTDKRAPAHALGDGESLVERAMQYQARAVRLGRLCVGDLELPQYLWLADYHRIETGADAEQMTRGIAAGETVNRLGERGIAQRFDPRPGN